MLRSCNLKELQSKTEENETTASATVGRRGDRPVHGITGIKHWAQGACTCVHVQPISDGLLGVHLLHFLRTMDRLGMVMHANYRDAMLLHPLNSEPCPANQHTYLHLMMFISFPCCSFVGLCSCLLDCTWCCGRRIGRTTCLPI